MKRRLVLVHGFTQNGGVWKDITPLLVGDVSNAGDDEGYGDVLTPDLPGHGSSAPQHDTAGLDEAARLLGDSCGHGVYVGYSLGARVVLHLALARPELVQAMVLVGAKGGYDDQAQAQQRRLADERLAHQLDELGQAGLEQFIDEWLKQPFNERVLPERQYRALRLNNRAEGLAASLRNCGAGTQRALWEQLPTLTMPVLVLWGEHDLAQVKADGARLVSAISANAQGVEVPGVGHAIAFEAPERFAELVLGLAFK